MTVEELAAEAVDCGLKVHQLLGPGLLESAYEKVLAHKLRLRGLDVSTQVPVPIVVDGVVIDQGFRADVVVADRLLIEIKSVERLLDVHTMQVMTYSSLHGISVGFVDELFGSKIRPWPQAGGQQSPRHDRLHIEAAPMTFAPFAASRPSRETSRGQP